MWLCNGFLWFCGSSDIGVTICARMMVTEDILGAGVTLHLLLLFRVIYHYHIASRSVDMVYFLLIWFLSQWILAVSIKKYCPCSYCSSCSRPSNLYELIHRKEFYSGAGQFQGPGNIITERGIITRSMIKMSPQVPVRSPSSHYHQTQAWSDY